MELDKLRINQLSPDGWAWYQDYMTALDAYDIDDYASFLVEDVTIQFNNDAPMTGLATARQGLNGFWGSITGRGYALAHDPPNIYGDDRHFVLEALNHYDRPDSARIHHPRHGLDRPRRGRKGHRGASVPGPVTAVRR